jgi:hypothetical protein
MTTEFGNYHVITYTTLVSIQLSSEALAQAFSFNLEALHAFSTGQFVSFDADVKDYFLSEMIGGIFCKKSQHVVEILHAKVNTDGAKYH